MTVPGDVNTEDGPQEPPDVDEEERSRAAWQEWVKGIDEPGEARERADG